jgi:hypothetical protein
MHDVNTMQDTMCLGIQQRNGVPINIGNPLVTRLAKKNIM